MKLWSAFLRDVRRFAPSTPDIILEHAVLRAAQKFCVSTRAWVIDLDPTTTIEGFTEYDMGLDLQVELVRLESATLNGEEYGIWRPGGGGSTRGVFTPDGKVVAFTQAVGADQKLVLRCSVKPGNQATGVDDFLYDRYLQEIALGAVADITGDGVKRLDFEHQCDVIKTRLWRGNAAIRPRARPLFM